MEHLLKEGKFEVGEALSRDTGIPEPLEIKKSYEQLQSILKEVKSQFCSL